ncbi:phage virion morphogenesis protein [Serratia marcescens]|uniref:Phage virion morphogenesis protein n=1 Tax=Serratia marcescens TaxID=615 RepID=A0A5C7C8J1_SERMA|nr:phage virion morphogenesis protein [Serratia marcescens]TXE33250.1 phage virion morphogenesis protein [Serratia marcescens]TXE65226.1 phage virion morphogenesis protein [Serratia marcescens]
MPDTPSFHAIDTWLQGLLTQLSSPRRKAMNIAIAREMRRRNQKRITQQKNPDGSPFIARKRLRDRQGRIRRAMFARLKTAKNMKVAASPGEAAVYFEGRKGYIARTHQYGREDSVSRNGPRVKYPARRLLGFDDASAKEIERQILSFLGKDL